MYTFIALPFYAGNDHVVEYLFFLKLKNMDADSISATMGKLDIGEPSSSFKKKPVIIIVVGMAGIGL